MYELQRRKSSHRVGPPHFVQIPREPCPVALAVFISCTRAAVPGASPAKSADPRGSSETDPKAGAAPKPREVTIAATKTGILVDAKPVCTADVTLVRGYSEGCAPGGLSAGGLESALANRHEDAQAGHELPVHATWLLAVDDDLPLVAFHQVVTTLYRANILDFTITHGGKRRAISNRRGESILVLRFRADRTFRVGVDSGTVELGPSCPRSYVELDDSLERCLFEVARRDLVLFIDLDAHPAVPGETRSVAFLWSILQRLRSDLAVAII